MNSIQTPFRRLRSARTLLLSLAFAALLDRPAGAAVTWHDIQFGGFASQGFLANTGHNDYLGDTSDGTFDFREYALNASWSTGKFRVGAQAFGQKLGDYGNDEIKLDWAIVDYQATQWFGLRAGRVKLPHGLYNEALDLDSVRPFVLLPQSVYDARLRDFSAAFNGGMAYGNVDFGHAGSLDYKLFYGGIPMTVASGAGDYFNQDVPFPNVDIGMDHALGGTLGWNTPVAGLRLVYSYSDFKTFNTIRLVPNALLGAPPLDGFTPFYRTTPDYHRHLASLEFLTGDWTFAIEAGADLCTYTVGPTGAPPLGHLDYSDIYAYASAARRLFPWLELGAYHSYSKQHQTIDTNTLVFPDLIQHDTAASARFDLNDHVLFKLEGHYLTNAGKIFDLPRKSQPVAARDNSWFMLAVKMTVSF